MSNEIENKVVLIAGVSSGIGEATKRRLARGGAKLVIGAPREEKQMQLAASLPDIDVSYQVADVVNPVDMDSLAQTAPDKYRRFDAIFNKARVMPTVNLSEIHRDE